MKYFLTVFFTSAFIVAAVTILNWAIDPAGIFHKTPYGAQYANALVASKHGLIKPDSLDEREYKSELAKHAGKYDCIVIGSSHVMQIGSARKRRLLPECDSILNLGVSGAGIEDHMTLTWLALSQENKPQKIFLGIDPWTFAYEKDERWKLRYPEYYRHASAEMLGDTTNESISVNRWSSLVSAEYTKRSISLLLQGAATPAIELAPLTDEDAGGAFPVNLPDGSHIYSSQYIINAKKARIPMGGGNYKVSGVLNDAKAIAAYQNLIKWIQKKAVQPVLLMTPYHHNVWQLETSLNVAAMNTTEAIVRKMGAEMAIRIIGSFHPDRNGCLPEEFYDFMHPTTSCIAKMNAGSEPTS